MGTPVMFHSPLGSPNAIRATPQTVADLIEKAVPGYFTCDNACSNCATRVRDGQSSLVSV